MLTWLPLLSALALAADPEQPSPPAVGIGLGIAAPQGAFAMNTASVRFKVGDDLVLEPSVGIDLRSDASSFEAGGTTTTSVTRTRGLGAGATARIRTAAKGPVNLAILASAGLSSVHTVNDPEGTDNNTMSDSTVVSTSWGLGTEWFVAEHFSLSADATNPLFSVVQTASRDELDTGVSRTTSLSGGLTWAPGVRLMGHVWF